jgi:hypothetical protein
VTPFETWRWTASDIIDPPDAPTVVPVDLNLDRTVTLVCTVAATVSASGDPAHTPVFGWRIEDSLGDAWFTIASGNGPGVARISRPLGTQVRVVLYRRELLVATERYTSQGPIMEACQGKLPSATLSKEYWRTCPVDHDRLSVRNISVIMAVRSI